jgi:hypothetical protein
MSERWQTVNWYFDFHTKQITILGLIAKHTIKANES